MFKRFVFGIITIAVVFGAFAETITLKWLNEGSTSVTSTTTCESGGDVTLPPTPTKTGYTFQGWKIKGYIPLEYLERTSDKNVSIDIGFIPDLNTEIKLKASTTNPGGDNYITCGGAGYDWTISFYNNAIGWHLCSNMRLDGGTTTQNTIYTIEAYNGGSIIDGTSYNCQPVTGKTYTDSLKILCRGNVKIYYIQIYQNSILVRDFVPALDSNNIPCMYDKVTEQFFYSTRDQPITGSVIGE